MVFCEKKNTHILDIENLKVDLEEFELEPTIYFVALCNVKEGKCSYLWNITWMATGPCLESRMLLKHSCLVAVSVNFLWLMDHGSLDNALIWGSRHAPVRDQGVNIYAHHLGHLAGASHL